MTARELYERNRTFYAEDWGVNMPPWDQVNHETRAAWGACALEYTVKALFDHDETEREDQNGT